MVIGGGTSALIPTFMYLLSPSHSLIFLGSLDEGTDWPLPMPNLVSLLAITLPQPTPAPTNAVFGEAGEHCWITLHMSLPAALAEEVLILGLELGETDRVVSSEDEETVIVGTVPPVTIQDEQTGGSTIKGEDSSSSLSTKASEPTRLGLIDVERSVFGNCDRKS